MVPPVCDRGMNLVGEYISTAYALSAVLLDRRVHTIIPFARIYTKHNIRTMKTQISVDGERFLINGRPTYEGVTYRGLPVEGLLFNSRMVQAIFDDECPDTRPMWAYPDTGQWDPDRNTDEFCRMLPVYRSYGLLAVTVGLQGGGSVYRPEVYDRYVNSAFTPEGAFKKPYFDRLLRVLKAADDAGMVVIVNYFYVKHARRFASERVVYDVTVRATEWLLSTGYRNILVDVANESAEWWRFPPLEPTNIPRVIEAVKSVSHRGVRLLVGSSTGGGDQIPTETWLDAEDITLPHGNGCMPDELRDKIRRIRMTEAYRKRPRPIVVNEDSIFVDNLEAAVREYASWGFYHQGYGSAYKDRRMDWTVRPRESEYAQLSGFQTVPVNWSINDEHKLAFFQKLKEITGGTG